MSKRSTRRPAQSWPATLREGDPFPSVRTLSRELRINQNTAHKVIAQLLNDGLIESHPGIGTVVAALPSSTAIQRTKLLNREIEELVVEAKRLSIDLNEVTSAIERHWKRLSTSPQEEIQMTIQLPAIEARQLSKTFGATQVLAPLDTDCPSWLHSCTCGTQWCGQDNAHQVTFEHSPANHRRCHSTWAIDSNANKRSVHSYRLCIRKSGVA